MELLEADKPQTSKTSSPSREPKEERETDTAIDKEATSHDDDGEGSGVSAILKRCSCLVEFVKCYGPVLDRVRMKQLLCSRQWRERKTCLTALNLAKPVTTGQYIDCANYL